MTVNISKNALNSQAGNTTIANTKTREVLSKLSSGVSLPDSEADNRAQTPTPEDRSIVSEEAANKSSQLDSSLDNITSMQEEVARLDNIQTALEGVSENLWGINEQAQSAQKQAVAEASSNDSTTAPAVKVETTDVSVDTSQYEADREEMQKITKSYLEGIDHTGSELMDFLEDYREMYLLDTEINTGNLGKSEDGSSLASLNGEVDLSSAKASDIIAKAQEEVASLQVSTEMHKTNLLNDIGKAIENFTQEVEQPEMEKGIEESIQEVSNMLLNNPSSISEASQINMSKASSLLIS